jgi:predicted RNA methylase
LVSDNLSHDSGNHFLESSFSDLTNAQVALSEIQSAPTPYESKVIRAADSLWRTLLKARALDANQAKALMNEAFEGSASDGAWLWKDFYEVQEVAFHRILDSRKGLELLSLPPAEAIWAIHQILDRSLTHTKRTEESVQLQQFSTPPPICYLAALCGGITEKDTVLEPSAGTGLLAKFSELLGAKLILNELSQKRGALLEVLFPEAQHFSCDAEQIHDYLPEDARPSVVIMNPPFSATPGVHKRNPDAMPKHVRSAFLRLPEGGRLVVISAHWFSPLSSDWKGFFEGLNAQVSVTALIHGDFYYKHGTTIKTRLTVIDKVPPTSPPVEIIVEPKYRYVSDGRDNRSIKSFTEEQVTQILNAIPPRAEIVAKAIVERSPEEEPLTTAPSTQRKKRAQVVQGISNLSLPQETVEVQYQIREATLESSQALGSLYEEYRPQRIEITGAKPHPTKLCESAALASVIPPIPTYIPLLPSQIVAESKLSFAQLETIVYAGEAHSQHLKGSFLVNDSLDELSAASPDDLNAVRFRKGWFLGDGTGAGKGRQIAGVILDNFLNGRTKAVWVSKSDKLVEDAKRDWVALGGDEADIISLSKYKQGSEILFKAGILFTTYATLRSAGKQGKDSRLKQITDWLGKDFEGVIAFDEAHAMGNAITEKGAIFTKEASQQGLTGLRLQNAVPDARVLYVSATGATKVSNLAYASRLGLWQSGDFPFASRDEFIGAIEKGGVAAMEVVCRDLKSLGLYLSRSLSFDGVDYDALEVPLTADQVSIYDTYAQAFKVIHNRMGEAMEACNITSSEGKSLNRQAKMSAHSMFESSKQRFFNHLLTSMKCPSMLRAIEQDINEGNSVIVQLVSTNESILDKRLKELPAEEWADLNIDITPRESVMSYLMHSFPTHLHKVLSDADGKLFSEPVVDAKGNMIVSKEAIEIRDGLINLISSLPPLPGALEQILHHFGHEQVAEITGRSIRILKEQSTGRLFASTRSASAGTSDAQEFLDDEKRILVFSEAGGTGRSYHADLGAINKRRRIHYLLEAGWRADNAIQGLGRSHRTNQASAPVFRPVVTDVRGERRFISTIARRLDELGALTRGQRETGGQGLFDPKDNLESRYAEASLDQFFVRLARNQISVCTMAEFEDATGLKLTTEQGDLKIELPNIPKFLNRILALPIQLQNDLFQAFENILQDNIERAIEAGTYDVGVETLKAEGFKILSREVVYTHPSGSKTNCLEIEEKRKREILSSGRAYEISNLNEGALYINDRSGRAAVAVSTSSEVSDSGASIERVSLIRPTDRVRMPIADLEKSSWNKASYGAWKEAWEDEVSNTSPFATSRFFMITGLLLPIWNSLDQNNMRVFRLRSDDGEVLLGRVIQPEDMAAVSHTLGLSQVKLRPEEVYASVMEQHKSHQLAGGITLRKSSVMNDWRLEIAGTFSEALISQLVANGCFTEIISWRKRVFLPANEVKALPVLEKVSELLRGY